MRFDVRGVKPEVVAAIAAAIQMMTTPAHKVVALRIRRSSNEWSLSARAADAETIASARVGSGNR